LLNHKTLLCIESPHLMY